jgi:hypothetical protein
MSREAHVRICGSRGLKCPRPPDRNTQPALDHYVCGSVTNNVGTGNHCSANGIFNINITGLVQSWSHNGYPSPEALALVAGNEGDSNQFKDYLSADTAYGPHISVTYNHPPNAPTSLAPAPATTNTTLTPALSATASQPDGNSARLDFQVFGYGGGPLVASGTTGGNVANGAVGTFTVPANALRGGQHYAWQVRAYDGQNYGPWSSYSDFTVSANACRSATLAG